MAIHSELSIYKTTYDLLSMAVDLVRNMPRIARGVDFVGQVVKPWHRSTRRRTFNDALARTAAAASDDLFETGNSYFGLFRQSTHSHHDRALLANLIRRRGRMVNRSLTQTYRQSLQ